MTIDLGVLKRWIGREQEFMDIVADQPVYALSATLDRDDSIPRIGDPIMPGAHWLFFQEIVRNDDLGEDGHPGKAGFLPPVPLPRRMWAGGRLRFVKDLNIGDTVTRKSVIKNIKHKNTRAGDAVFVTVAHEIGDDHGIAVWEEQDIVYTPRPDRWDTPPVVHPRPAMPVWVRARKLNPVMLFRYSALTFNSHRIHYDHVYATKEEGYAGLVAQAPLVATMLMHFTEHESEKKLKAFSFRVRAPIFAVESFEMEGLPDDRGDSAKVWAMTSERGLAMEAEADFDDGESINEEREKIAQHVDMSMEPTIDATWEVPDGDETTDLDDT